MASRKDELKKAEEAGKSIVTNKFASDASTKTDTKTDVKEAPVKKEEPVKKEQSLVANKFGAKKEKTWNDVKSEYNNDPVKIADYLNSATDYTPGNLTKKGMEEFGYSQSADGKWAPETKTTTPTTETKTADTTSSATTNATTDDSISELEKIMTENEKLRKQIEALQNPDGSIKKDEAKSALDEYMQKGLEMGAVTLDKDGNYVLTNVNKKGWEDWATMISAGASVIGLAMGVPIIPINFRKITGRDEKDKAIREFQKQLTDISADNLAKVKEVESSKEAGDYIKQNQDSIDAFTNYAEKTAAYKAKSDINTDSEKELIDKNLEAEMALVDAEFKNKIGEMKLSHEQKKDLEELMSGLSTDSAKELLNQERYGYLIDMVRDMKDANMDDRAVALKLQSLAGNTATTQNLKHAESIVGMFTDILDSVWGGKKKK